MGSKALVIVTTSAALAALVGSTADATPAPAPSSEACATCHADIAAEWRGSLHRQSFTDAVFQRGYVMERQAFCRGCHAPAADPRHEPPRVAVEEGVGCSACHLARGHAESGRPHADLHARGGEAACAGCHQFDFPGSSNQVVPSPMQRTVSEWRSSSHAGEACASCHMPRVGSHTSHAFAVRTPEMLQRAVGVTAARTAADRVRITLAPGGAGHAFPTGDMFRRIEVRAEAIDERGEVVASARPALLSRNFRDVIDLEGGGVARRVEGPDRRVGAPGTADAARVVDLGVKAAGRRVRWEVAYQRMIAPAGTGRGLDAPVDEVVLASGLLPAEVP